MRASFSILFLALGAAPLAAAAIDLDDLFDRADDALHLSLADNQIRARLSGQLDLEFYHYDHFPADQIDPDRRTDFNPRLSLFLDAQLGPRIYVFSQVRLDRGFDGAAQNAEIRLDEYALRLDAFDDGRLNFQIGKFATAVGNWVERHLSWENPFITAPLVYGNLTGVSDASYEGGFVSASPRYDRVPIVWGPSYTTGARVSGALGRFDYALELKNASVSSRPETWSITNTDFAHPSVDGRIGWRPNESWNVGFSFAEGPYLRPSDNLYLPKGSGIADFPVAILGQDLSYAWRHFQLWAECYEARFDAPGAGRQDSLGYYIEAKYKFATRWYGALRWNQQVFATAPGAPYEITAGDDAWRIDAALGYRLNAHAQVKLQASFEREDIMSEAVYSRLIAAQFTVRF